MAEIHYILEFQHHHLKINLHVYWSFKIIGQEIRKGTLSKAFILFWSQKNGIHGSVSFQKLFCMNVLLFFWSCKTSKWQRDWWHKSYQSKRNAGKAIDGWQFWHFHVLQHFAGVHINIHNITQIGQECLGISAYFVIFKDFSLNAVANYLGNDFVVTNKVQVWGISFEDPLSIRLWKAVINW